MSRFKRNSKKDYLKYGALVLLLMLTLGYALLSSNLNITGTSNFARTTWNIHFENLVPSTNMILGQGEGASITQNKTTEVTYTLNFTEPGQYYEFLVDAKNDGTIDGMVNTITSTIKIGEGNATPITTNPSNLPAYLEYSATYADGTPIEEHHLLKSTKKETYKVRVAFSTDIEAGDLPGSDQNIQLTFGVEYVQKDSNAIPSHPPVEVYTTNDDSVVVTVGQALPNGITTYQTPALAMAANPFGDEYPFFFKHTLIDDVVSDSYVGFVLTDDDVEWARTVYIEKCNNDQTCIDEYQGITAGTYYIKAKPTHEYVNNQHVCKSEYDDGEGHCINPEYNNNKAILLSAFGSSNCSEVYDNMFCSLGVLDSFHYNIGIYKDYGHVAAQCSDGVFCDIFDDGASYCFLFSD